MNNENSRKRDDDDDDDHNKINISHAKPLRQLSSKELGDRLRSFGLKKAGDVLEKEGCNGDDFADFEEEDVEFFNIPSESFKQILSGKVCTKKTSGNSFQTIPSGLSPNHDNESVIVVNSNSDLFSFDSSDASKSPREEKERLSSLSSVGSRGRQYLRRSLERMSTPPTPLSPSTSTSSSNGGVNVPAAAPPVPPKLSKNEKSKILHSVYPSNHTKHIFQKRQQIRSSQNSIIKNESADDVKILMRKLSQTLMNVNNDIVE